MIAPFMIALRRVADGQFELLHEYPEFLAGRAAVQDAVEGRVLTALVAFKPIKGTECEFDFLGFYAYPVNAEGRYCTPGRPSIPPAWWAPTQLDMDAFVKWLLAVDAATGRRRAP